MLFNFFLPFISAVIYLGTYLYSNPIFMVLFLIVSVSMTFYAAALCYETLFNYEGLKTVFSELPLSSLEKGVFRKTLGYLLIYAPVFGIFYISYVRNEYGYLIWWTFIFFMLIFFMYRLKNIKKELINKKKENYEE